MENRVRISFLLVFVIVFNISHGTKKCSPVSDQTKEDFMCTDITSIVEILPEIERSWFSVAIVNEPETIFTISDVRSERVRRPMDFIETLDLSQAGTLSMYDDGFKQYKYLTKVVMSGCDLNWIKNSWFRWNSFLEHLDVSSNQLKTLVANDTENLKGVKLANFTNTGLESVEKNTFLKMPVLEVLDLSYNMLRSIDLGEAPQLLRLSLVRNKIAVVPTNGFVGMPFIEFLDLSLNVIEKLEDRAFFGLITLKALNLSRNSIEEIRRKMFEGLSQVKIDIVDLSENNIRSISPRGFQQLAHLKTLKLSDNALTELGEFTFKGLKTIRELDLENNAVSIIGDNTFGGLASLEVLDLSGNILHTLNNNMFGSGNRRLKKLSLMRNNLKALSSTIFTGTRNLEFLSLSYNEIKHFPSQTFVGLRKLKKFHIAANQMEELTADLINATFFVTELEIHHNKLTFLPDIFATLPYLTNVAIEANPWQCRCLDEVLKFLDSNDIDYSKTNYFDGKRPVCVPTPVSYCVKDVEFAQRQGLAEIYERNQ